MTSSWPREPGSLLPLAYLLGSAFLLLNPFLGLPLAILDAGRSALESVGMTERQAALLEPIANIMIFIPVPWLILRYLPVERLLTALLMCFVMAGAVEGVQALLLPERTPSLSDLVNNTLGAVIGAAALLAWQTWLNGSRDQTLP